MLKKKITNNIFLKILALLVAFILWLLVVNFDDPVVYTTYSGVPVEVINADALTDQGKVYEIINNTGTISVTIYGTRSVVDSISKENIRAIADMEDLTLMNTISIQLSTNKNFDKLETMRSDIQAVELEIEDMKVVNLPINMELKGEPASGYIAGDVVTNQNTVRISGPKSVVEQIAYVEGEVDISNRVSDITTNVDLRFYDVDGIQIEHHNLVQNIRSINVSVAILATKEIPVNYHISGTPAEGYIANPEVTADYMTVRIAGRQSLVDSITSLEIPAAALNVEDREADFSMVVNLERYLPDGIRLADANFDGNATAQIQILKTVTRTLNVPLSNITILNVPEDVEAVIRTEGSEDDDLSSILMQLQTAGISDAYTGVTGASTRGTVDMSQYIASSSAVHMGVYRVEIDFELPEGIEAQNVLYLDVELKPAE